MQLGSVWPESVCGSERSDKHVRCRSELCVRRNLDCNLVTEEEMIVEWKEEKTEIWRQVGTDRDGETR